MMLFHFLCALPFLRLAQCTNDPLFEEKTFDVEETVTLRCPRDASETSTLLFWMRFISGHLPESLGGAPSYDDKTLYESPHSSIVTKQDPGTFSMSINGAQLNDTGFYYCVKVQTLTKNLIFVSTTFLKIKGPDSDLSVESADLSGAVDSGDSVDLQCWVQTENAHCFEEHMVLWFMSGLNQASPGLVYAQRNSSGRCKRSSEEHGPHKCFYTFSKTTSPSDTGTYRCAVAACGQILFGNRVDVNVEAEKKCVVEKIVIIGVIAIFGLICVTVPVCWTVKKLNKPNKDQSKQKLQVLTRKADCEAALHRAIKAAETEAIYTHVTFVYVK